MSYMINTVTKVWISQPSKSMNETNHLINFFHSLIHLKWFISVPLHCLFPQIHHRFRISWIEINLIESKWNSLISSNLFDLIRATPPNKTNYSFSTMSHFKKNYLQHKCLSVSCDRLALLFLCNENKVTECSSSSYETFETRIVKACIVWVFHGFIHSDRWFPLAQQLQKYVVILHIESGWFHTPYSQWLLTCFGGNILLNTVRIFQVSIFHEDQPNGWERNHPFLRESLFELIH